MTVPLEVVECNSDVFNFKVIKRVFKLPIDLGFHFRHKVHTGVYISTKLMNIFLPFLYNMPAAMETTGILF